jgi:hypothetical protein
MPITNGHEVETGCVADGANRGWYVGRRVIEEAESLGWELDAEGVAAVELYYSGETDVEGYDDAADIVSNQGGILDEAEQWLNDHTSEGFVWCWFDGSFFLSPICENGDCDDETCAHWSD